MKFDLSSLSGLSGNDSGVDLSKLGFDSDGSKKEIENIKDSEQDILELESFCKKHGIIMGPIGTMSAKQILLMLKQRLGIIEENKSTRILLKD